MALLRSRSLGYLDEVSGAEPLGKSGLNILGVKFDVNAPGANRFIQRQAKHGTREPAVRDVIHARFSQGNVAEQAHLGLTQFLRRDFFGLHVFEIAQNDGPCLGNVIRSKLTLGFFGHALLRLNLVCQKNLLSALWVRRCLGLGVSISRHIEV